MTNLYDLSTWAGRKAVLKAVADSDLLDDLKNAIKVAVNAYPKPRGRPPDPTWKKLQKTLRGMVIDTNAPRGQQTTIIETMSEKEKKTTKTIWDRIKRPNRVRKKL